ncbi:MAG: nickel-responsive transcriptional regulator NikR, partial [Candidatus Cloacimonetes bacterium]|nr:nickel-responsive transcriptional regulator NikR [Candidatus Cloacimonadota bacterium]
MSELIRFGVSLEKELLELFDSHIRQQRSGNRSQAIANLIREELIRQEWLEDKIIAGVITLVYNHHQRELVNRLTDIQHDYHHAIITSQHIHLDHDNCFEIIVVTG